MNAMVDAGGVTYLGLWGIGEVAPDAQVSHLLSGYLGLACVLVTGHVYFFHVAVPEEEDDDRNTLEETKRSTEHDSARVLVKRKTETRSEETPTMDEDGAVVVANAPVSIVGNNSASMGQSASNITSKYEYEDTKAHDEQEGQYVIVADRLPRNQILSRRFVDPSVPSIHDSKGDDDVTLSDDPGYVPDT